MRTLISLALALSVAPAAHGQCTQSNGRHANVGSVQLNLQGFSSTTAIQQGMAMWNSSSCNAGNDDFPVLQLGPGAEATLTVRWEPGYNPSNDRVCGSINHDTQTITLYGQVRDPEGFARNCALDGIVADNLAHEVGHYLGLADITSSSCSNYIMFGVQFQSNGTYRDRSVQPAECYFADDANTTTQEYQTENKDDPYCEAYGCSPLLFDLDENGFHLTGLANPVAFDINADGHLETIAWTQSGQFDAFLCLDLNSNGVIDDGGELFGNHTRLPDGSFASNGYFALAAYDDVTLGGNADGFISPEDEIYERLRLWVDSNHDGSSQPGELHALSKERIRRIGLDFRRSSRTDRYGNEFRFLGRAWKEVSAGVLRPILTWDVFFVSVP